MHRAQSSFAHASRWRARSPWRRCAVVSVLAVSGCHYASSPLVGFPSFIGDTHTFNTNPNMPPGSDENLRRSAGADTALAPLLPEGGNIWPGPAPPVPSLSEIQARQNQEEQQLTPPPPPPRGSSTAPGLYAPQPVPSAPAPQSRAPSTYPSITTAPPVVNTPSGPLINNGPVGVPGGIGSATNPVTGGQSIVVPNGNGTSTVIAPDGSTQIVPAPK